MAWKKLTGCRQCETEDPIDYYKRFVGMIEMVKLSFGNIKPNDDDDDKEQSKFIATMFIQGVDWKQCGYLKNMETNHSLGNVDVYPNGIESALQVLILYSKKQLKQKKQAENQLERPIVSVGCWECGSKDHLRHNCEIWKAKNEARLKAKEAGASKCQAVSKVNVAVPQWMAWVCYLNAVTASIAKECVGMSPGCSS